MSGGSNTTGYLHYFIEIRNLLVKLFFFSFSDCPGTASDTAGKASACQGCPNQKICASAPKGPDPGNFISKCSCLDGLFKTAVI